MLPAALRGSRCPMTFRHSLSLRGRSGLWPGALTQQAQLEGNPAPTAAGCAGLLPSSATVSPCPRLCFLCHHLDKPHPHPRDCFWKRWQEQSQGRPLPASAPPSPVTVTTVPSKKKLLLKSQLLGYLGVHACHPGFQDHPLECHGQKGRG